MGAIHVPMICGKLGMGAIHVAMIVSTIDGRWIMSVGHRFSGLRCLVAEMSRADNT